VKNAIRLKSDYADAYNTLGIIQLQQERFDEAKSSIEMALKLNPGYSLAWLNLGLVHRSLGNSNEIKACLEKAVSGNPRMAKAWVVLAQDAIDNGHFDIAGKYLEIAENVDPEGVEAWSAKVLLKKMKPSDSDWIEKAEALLGKAKTSSAVSNLRFSMGKYYDDIGDYDKAFDSYKQANDLAGASKNTMMILCEVYSNELFHHMKVILDSSVALSLMFLSMSWECPDLALRWLNKFLQHILMLMERGSYSFGRMS